MKNYLDKSAIRCEMRARRKALSAEARARASHIICEKIIYGDDSKLYRMPREAIVAFYLAGKDEIDLKGAIHYAFERGMTVVVPRWNGSTYEMSRLNNLEPESLRTGPMGILEPKGYNIVDPSSVTIWYVPGLAFTPMGHRLGYGGGWYDRLMSGADFSLKFGVAYGFQIVPDLPIECHDIRMNAVISDD